MTTGALVQQLGSGPGGSKYTDPDNDVPVRYAAFSPDGTLVVTTVHDAARGEHRAHLWDATTGGELRRWVDVSFASFPPGADGVLIIGRDGSASIRSPESDAEVVRFEPAADGREGRCSALKLSGAAFMEPPDRLAVFSPGGTHMAAWSDRGAAGLWDAASGRLLYRLDPADECVDQIVFSGDGGSVAALADGCAVRVWNVESGALMSRSGASGKAGDGGVR
jgi:WD40 repeat protein